MKKNNYIEQNYANHNYMNYNYMLRSNEKTSSIKLTET